jgi:riboflavin synthase
MFTGIVEERGSVRGLAGGRLTVACGVVTRDSAIGASVAVNGTCLTVIENDGSSLAFDLSEETLDRTTLRDLEPGSFVNLERPVTLAARLGGHIVQGHVDAVGEITAVEPDDEGGALVRIVVPPDLLRYIVYKGSITVDGVSLTVAAIEDGVISIALIPHTRAVTTFGTAGPGVRVNLEVDVLAKYVERLMKGPE